MKKKKMNYKPRCKLPFKFIIESFIMHVTNIYIRTVYCQYIKKFLVLKSISFLIQITPSIKENVNNALNIFKISRLIYNMIIMYNKENNFIKLKRLAKNTVEDAVIYDKPYMYEMCCFLYSGRYLTLTSTQFIKLKKSIKFKSYLKT